MSFQYGDVGEEFKCLMHSHVQHIGNTFVLVSDLQSVCIETLSPAGITGDIHIGQEMHFDFNQTVALTGFAASPFDIEAEAPRLVAAQAGLRQACKQLADKGENSRIGYRIGAGGAPDRLLIDHDDPLDISQVADLSYFSHRTVLSAQTPGHDLVEGFDHHRAFARAGHAGHRGQNPDGNFNINIF